MRIQALWQLGWILTFHSAAFLAPGAGAQSLERKTGLSQPWEHPGNLSGTVRAHSELLLP